MGKKMEAENLTYTESDIVRKEVFLLMAYLATAAHGNTDEAPGYGPLRLLEAVQRSIILLDHLNIADNEFAEWNDNFTKNTIKIMHDKGIAQEFADRLAALLISKLEGIIV